MKMTIVLLTIACLQLSAKGYTQSVTLTVKNVPLEKVFKELKKQTGYDFWYESKLLDKAKRVNLEVKNISLKQALDECFKDQPFAYSIVDKIIVVKLKPLTEFSARTPNATTIEPPSLIDISGVITDDKGQPLGGATILVKGTNIGTKSDANGSFFINAEPASTLIISFVGFESTEVKIGNRTNITVQLRPSVSVSDEVVVIGYGTQKRSSVTASISRIQNKILDQVPSGRLETALIGRMAGVNISTINNVPGTAPIIRIRGLGSISAGNGPLIVIDGFPGGDLGQLDMNDVESIEALKDASSSAIYGSRGAGGVVLVTTKRGTSGKARLSLNSYYGISKAMLHQDWMVGKEWHDYLVKYQNREFAWAGGDVSIPVFGDPRRPITYQVNPLTEELPQTIWQNEASQTAPIQNYNLSVSGGSENVKYYVSGTYSNEKGTIKTAFYEKYSFRANLDVKINNKISFGMELNPSFSKQRIAGSNNMVNISKYPPFVSPNKVNGSYPRTFDYIPTGHSGQASPYTYIYGTKNYQNTFSNLGRAFLNLKLLEGLSLKTSVGTNLGFGTTNYWSGGIGDPGIATNGRVAQSQFINLINENVLSYSKTINKHNIEGILGASYQRENSQNSTMSAVPNSFNNEIVETLNNAIVNPSTSTQTKSQWGLISYFGRLNYAYKDRYLFTASFRTDGSSRFGADNKWGNFPSVSTAWRVSKEKFMQNISTVNDLKLRASYGITGNFNIGNFQYLGVVSNAIYSPDNQTVNGIAQTSIENSSLSWEKVKGYDLGIDLGLLNNRLNLSFDYYDKRTFGMLYNVNIPAISGFSTAIENVGSVRNHGIDIEINTRNLVRSFKWNTSFNFSKNNNEVVDLGGVDEKINTGRSMGFLLRKGIPMFSFYGYKMVGVFQNAEQLEKLPHLAGATTGTPIMKDINSDGKIDLSDKVVLGNFQPKELLGISNEFSWGKFDMSIFLQASLGAKMFNFENAYYQGAQLGALRRSLVQNEWWSADDPGDGKTPAIGNRQLTGYITVTDFYIEDASFLNIRNLNFGYNLSNLVQPIGIKRLRIYCSASNLLMIKNKNNHGYNPEGATHGEVFGISSTPGFNENGSEPINRTIVFGFNVEF